VEISFFVAGKPQPRGSKRAFPFKRKNGKLGVAVSDMNPNSKDWMGSIAQAAQAAMDGQPPIIGPVSVSLQFIMPRPASHHVGGKKDRPLKPTAPDYHTIKPDRGKLARAVEDALTAIVYADDAQAAAGPIEKIYGQRPGVNIYVTELNGANT
jgi:crossover junction endodeoxyribonuclease RusA